MVQGCGKKSAWISTDGELVVAVCAGCREAVGGFTDDPLEVTPREQEIPAHCQHCSSLPSKAIRFIQGGGKPALWLFLCRLHFDNFADLSLDRN